MGCPIMLANMPKPAIVSLYDTGIDVLAAAVMMAMNGKKVAIRYAIKTTSANINFAHTRVRIYIIRRRRSFITA